RRIAGVFINEVKHWGTFMRRSPLICIGSVALALTAGAQMPYNSQHRKTPQRTEYPGYRGTSAVRQMPPQRTFSSARYRQLAFSNARYRQPTFSTTGTQPRTKSSFVNRPAMTSTSTWSQRRSVFSNDWAGSRLNPQPRPSSAFVHRSAIDDVASRRQTHLTTANQWRESRFSERPRSSSSVLNRFTMNDAAVRPEIPTNFNNHRTN